MFKAIKIFLMFLGILFGVVIIFGAFHLYRAYMSGDFKSYFTKFAVESVLDESKLSPTQKEYLENGDYESLVKNIEENVTQEQIDCVSEEIGKDRASELLINQDPTPQEIIKLSKCL